MRKLLIFILLSGSLHAQDNNNLVIKFIDNNYGEKVGDGVCIDLLYGVRDFIDSTIGYRDSVMDDVSAEEIKAGDLVDFRGVVFADGRKAEKHMAFIYSIVNGAITIAEQNVGSSDEGENIIRDEEEIFVVKDSHVVFEVLDLKEVVSGKISFYRL